MESHQYESASRGCTSWVDQQRTAGAAREAPTSASGIMGRHNKAQPWK
jgi:hypothetical protein